MTKRQKRDRITAIIRELVEMSSDGWKHAKPSDYIPLEQELRDIRASLPAEAR